MDFSLQAAKEFKTPKDLTEQKGLKAYNKYATNLQNDYNIIFNKTAESLKEYKSFVEDFTKGSPEISDDARVSRKGMIVYSDILNEITLVKNKISLFVNKYRAQVIRAETVKIV